MLRSLCLFVLLGINAAYIQGAQAQTLSDADLWQKINVANPNKSQRVRLKIFVCHKTDPVCPILDKDYKGLSPEKLTAYIRKTDPQIDIQAEEYLDGRRKIETKSSEPRQAGREREKTDRTTSAYVLVRRTLEDISSLTLPKDPKDVTGAQFSYNRDNVSANTSWSARGVIAVPIYSADIFDPSGDRYAVTTASAVAPFIAFDKVTNSSSALAKSNLNNLNLGIISEYAINNVGRDKPVDHYLRLNSGTNMDFEGNLKSWYLRGEWEPASTASWLNTPIAPLSSTGFNFTPLIKARIQYDGQAGSIPQPLFLMRNEALRIGPRVGIQIQPVTGLWANWFNSFTLTATYSYFYDTFSRRDYGLFDSALNYNIDEAGNYALSASYRKGKLEETGASVDQVMFGLAVKLNQEIYSNR